MRPSTTPWRHSSPRTTPPDDAGHHACNHEAVAHDLILRGGAVYDGLGSPAVTADVAITGDAVVAIGKDLGEAKRIIDVDGLAVAPGFIDPHAHSDMVALMTEPQPFKLEQGVTTEIVGNCGFSFAPLSEAGAAEARRSFGELTADAQIEAGSFSDHLDRLEAAGPANNIASLVGHNAIRLSANGMEQKLAEGALEEMQRLLAQAFEQGAVGLSTGLIYTPGAWSDTDEIVALAQVAHRWGRPYASHMRDEGPGLAEALDEAIEIGRRARIPVQVSHCKAAGASAHGGSKMLLDKIRNARLEGVDVRGDQYPYQAGSTFLAALLPPEVHVGGIDEVRRRLGDAAERERLRRVAEDPSRTTGVGLWAQGTPADVLIVRHFDRAKAGRTLADVAGADDPWETLCDAVAQDPTAMMVITLMAEDDVRTIMADPLIAIGSDSGIPDGLDHPRTWGCFPRFLGTYVRELGIVDWPEGIRKVTSASAAHFGLTGRGWLGAGSVADVCVFDPATIGHSGTYLEPAVKPTGIEHVVVGGDVVIESGQFSGARAGRVIRAQASSSR